MKLKPIVSVILAAAMLVLFFSCENKQNEDITHTVDKSGAVETALQVMHLDSTHDILVTTHKIWATNQLYRTIVYRDTLPALGTENTIAENQDGDTKNVSLKKDYEIFITVK
ncbi:MAG: hypothetical protein NVS3B15_01040 [Sediminibacterium sp.]